MIFDFTDYVVMIPGAMGNLGGAVTRRFQTAGAQLALLDIQEGQLFLAYPELVGSQAYQLLGNVDMTDYNSVKKAVAKISQHFGRVDVLVNIVGGYHAGNPLHETPLDAWEKMINLNARSVFNACRATIPLILEAGSGNIINISARPGLRGRANMSAYSAAKGSVIRLTESMSLELREHGINVNCIVPGTIDTPENRQSLPGANHDRWVQPESIADIILFLASDISKDIHGATIPVYGLS
jgi:NAD(P)-dependent dehydrogenase (short-subunit alcohol dehydrogenase family)